MVYIVVFRSSSSSLKDLLNALCSDYFTGTSEPCTVVVHRRNLLASVLRATTRPTFDFHKRVNIVFAGEDAADNGGPSREFMRY